MGEELSSLYNLLVNSSASSLSSSRSLTSCLTLAAVSVGCFPLDASLISVDKKFLHFFTFSIVSLLSVTVVTVVPAVWLTVPWLTDAVPVAIEL